MLNIFKTKIVPIIWSVSVVMMIIIGVVSYFSFDQAFYEKMYEENHTATNLEMSESDLTEATNVLLDYLRNYRDNLDVMVKITGETQPMFNEREISHMVDVKNLYQASVRVGYISFLIFIISSLWLIFTLKKDTGYFLAISFNKTLIVIGVALGFIVIFSLVDFNRFWTAFHHVFFSNDLWILDPRVDRLINLVPLNFFNQLVSRIIIGIVALLTLVLGGLNFWKKKIL